MFYIEKNMEKVTKKGPNMDPKWDQNLTKTDPEPPDLPKVTKIDQQVTKTYPKNHHEWTQNHKKWTHICKMYDNDEDDDDDVRSIR